MTSNRTSISGNFYFLPFSTFRLFKKKKKSVKIETNLTKIGESKKAPKINNSLNVKIKDLVMEKVQLNLFLAETH